MGKLEKFLAVYDVKREVGTYHDYSGSVSLRPMYSHSYSIYQFRAKNYDSAKEKAVNVLKKFNIGLDKVNEVELPDDSKSLELIVLANISGKVETNPVSNISFKNFREQALELEDKSIWIEKLSAFRS